MSSSSPLRYAIINCYDSAKWQPIGWTLWRDSLIDPHQDEEWVVFHASEGELPDDTQHFDGFVITGSPRGAYEEKEHPWIAKLAAWLRSMYVESPSSSHPRIVGGCFGAQMIGHTLGGLVEAAGYHTMKNEQITLTPTYASFDWTKEETKGTSSSSTSSSSTSSSSVDADTANTTAGAGATLSSSSSSSFPSTTPTNTVHLIESHSDCVKVLPPKAILLGSSPSCVNEYFLLGNCLAIQSHPEFDLDHVVIPLLVPGAVKKINDEKIFMESMASFERESDSARILRDIKRFLKWSTV